MSRLTERLGNFIGDTTHYLNVAAAEGRSILLEGAQATLLDVDHGTYPLLLLPAQLWAAQFAGPTRAEQAYRRIGNRAHLYNASR